MIDLIGIHGLLGVGKDSLASFLTDHTPYSFADPLRKGLLALDPWIPTDDGRRRLTDVVSTEGWDEAKKIPEVRRLMQVYGTEAGRDIHGQDCWVNIAEQFIDNNHKVAIRDVRFHNEIDAIYSWEFSKPKLKNRVVTVKIVGESRRDHEQSATKHSSEHGLPDYLFDLLLFNDGTLEDLAWAAKYIANNPPPKRQLKLICHSRTISEVVE